VRMREISQEEALRYAANQDEVKKALGIF